jgi:hypothetical protein
MHVLKCHWKDSSSLITEDDDDGYVINKGNGSEETEQFNCNLEYRFYHVDPQQYSVHLNIDMMQQISIDENEKLQSSVTEEKTHR